MKVIITADVHLGINGKLNYSLFALKSMHKYAIDNDIKHIIVNGDLFNDRTSLNLEVANRSLEVFDSIKNDDIEIIAFPGNHDMFMRNSWDITSLKPFGNVIKCYHKPSVFKIGGRRFFVIPFIEDEDNYLKIRDTIAKKMNHDDVLLTHIGIANSELNVCFLLKYWSVINFNDFPYKTFGGHFHVHQTVGNFVYPGSPVAFRYDEGMVDHGFVVLDLDDLSYEFVVTEEHYSDHELFPDYGRPPGFLTITNDMVDSIDEKLIAGNNVRIALNRDFLNDELVDIKKKFVDLGVKDVKWMKRKEKEIDLEKHTSKLNLGDPRILFEKWLEIDKPDGININDLIQYNEIVIDEGNEVISNLGDENVN